MLETYRVTREQMSKLSITSSRQDVAQHPSGAGDALVIAGDSEIHHQHKSSMISNMLASFAGDAGDKSYLYTLFGKNIWTSI
jgi:hypothetical protein